MRSVTGIDQAIFNASGWFFVVSLVVKGGFCIIGWLVILFLYHWLISFLFCITCCKSPLLCTYIDINCYSYPLKSYVCAFLIHNPVEKNFKFIIICCLLSMFTYTTVKCLHNGNQHRTIDVFTHYMSNCQLQQ